MESCGRRWALEPEEIANVVAFLASERSSAIRGQILELTVGAPEQLKKLVAVAHEKGCKVVAEGIETPEHLALVQHAGADYGQGYLFARPLPEAELLSRLDQEFSFESYLWKKF
jgi:hypothetical protein